MDNSLLRLLGIARRAGRLSLGADAVRQSVQRKQAKLVLFAPDFSAHTAQSIAGAAEEAGIQTAGVRGSMDEIEAAVGKRAGVIAVNDEGFAKKLLALNAQERGGNSL